MRTAPDGSGDFFGPGLGETQRHLLLTLKERGPSTVTALSGALGLAATTLRGHLQALGGEGLVVRQGDRKSTRLNSSHVEISYAVFCLKKKTKSHTVCAMII